MMKSEEFRVFTPVPEDAYYDGQLEVKRELDRAADRTLIEGAYQLGQRYPHWKLDRWGLRSQRLEHVTLPGYEGSAAVRIYDFFIDDGNDDSD